MPPLTPPNPALAELISVLGEADTQDIVRTFLSDAPDLMASLAPSALFQSFNAAERAKRHRAAHSLKSSARLVGADIVADRAAIFERRLSLPDGKVSREDVAALAAELAAITPSLQNFAGAGR